MSDTCHTLPLLPPMSRQADSRRKSPMEVGGERKRFFLLHLVLIVWSPYKSLSHSVCLSLSLTLFSLTGSFFLHTWIPVGVCNSKHSLGKMLVAAPSPHGLTGPIPLALRPEEYGHMTSNILIWGLGCILSNRKLFFVLFCFSPLPNQQKYFTFRHFRHFHYCRLFYGGPMAEI